MIKRLQSCFRYIGWGTVVLRCLVSSVLAAPWATTASAQNWSRSYESAMQGPAPDASRIAHMDDSTLRQVVRISVGGQRLRIDLSNEKSPAALRIASVHVALQSDGHAVVPGSDREVRFGSQPSVTIAARANAVSDPVPLALPPLAKVVVSIFFAGSTRQVTFHGVAGATGALAPGEQTAAGVLRGAQPVQARAVLAAIDVDSATSQPVVVAIGDSITDGVHSTPDADRRWPDILADRLREAGLAFGVANAGIASNQLLSDGVGSSGLSRFGHDALADPGVTHVIVLEGINDIGIATTQGRPLPTAAMLIDGYRQLITQAHARHVKIAIATLLPFKGARYWSVEGDRIRQTVNSWIRGAREADGFIDFERAVANSTDPLSLKPEFDSGDHLHPNDSGYHAMAQAIDLALLS